MRKWNEPWRGQPRPIGNDETQPKHHRRRAERKHDERVKDPLEAGGLGQRKGCREPKQEREEDRCACVANRVKGGLDRWDIKDGAAAVNKEFSVVIGGEAILHFAALAAVCFEPEERAEREGRKRGKEEHSQHKAESSNKDFFAESVGFANVRVCRARGGLNCRAGSKACVEDGKDHRANQLNDR